MEVRGANTFPLLNRLPNLNLVAMTILSISFLFVGFIDIFPFLLGINKARWRLCCTSNARKRVESHFYRYNVNNIIQYISHFQVYYKLDGFIFKRIQYYYSKYTHKP